ncbi:MAG TPA: hypothetical protein VFU43_05325 [Streptosporangiaceae bacterium]|nr:hypothetical protein [Streptosporangiaceae bacterium]
MTDQPRQEAPGESGPATDPIPPVPPQPGPQRDWPHRPDRPERHGQRPAAGPGDRAGRWALALGGAALLLMLVFPPAAPLPAAAALVVGVRARRRDRRAARPPARGALAGIVLGSVGLVISIPLATTQIVLWGELHRYLDCRQSANTIADEQACKETFVREVERKFNLREGSLKHYDIPL